MLHSQSVRQGHLLQDRLCGWFGRYFELNLVSLGAYMLEFTSQGR